MENQQIEQFAIKHWPALEFTYYDGWKLSFSNGYTKRANCIHILEDSTLPLKEKITHCESLYEAIHLPTIFKLVSFQSIEDIDKQLEDKNYLKIDESRVLTVKLDRVTLSASNTYTVEQSCCLSQEWLNFHLENKDLTSEHKAAFHSIIEKIECDVRYFMIKDEEKVIACCVGVLEDNCVSVYCLGTAESHRKKGLATELLSELFNWAKQKGATSSYILVVANNTPAVSLYTKIGYKHAYSYWFRVKY